MESTWRATFPVSLRSARGIAPTALVLTILVGIGVWGHATKWKLTSAPANAGHGDPHGADVDAANTPVASDRTVVTAVGDVGQHGNALYRIELRSAEAVDKCGLQLVTVRRVDMHDEVLANGEVVYDQARVAQLSARASGAVWRIEKQVGQPVKKGDVLAIIEGMEVGRAKADFLQAIVSHDLKAATHARLKSSAAVIPFRHLLEAEAAVRDAHIHMINAHQTLVNLGLPIRLEDLAGMSDDELARRIQFLGLPESIVAGLDPATTTASLIPVVSPFDGVVIGREVAFGEVVSPDKTQFVVADVSRVWINLDVRKEDAARLKLGQEIAFSADGVANAVQTRIAWISTEVDEQTRTVPVRAEVDNPLVGAADANGPSPRLLRANTFGVGRLRLRDNPQATIVPTTAVQWDGHRHLAFVRTGETTFEARQVAIGVATAENTEIVAGIEPGAVVVGTGSHLLKSEILRSRMVSAGQ